MTERTTLAELFKIWLAAKSFEDGILEQTVGQYRQVWSKHGADQLGALRISELPTSRANAHIQAVALNTPSQAAYLRIILRAMSSMAVRFDVLAVNPISETKTAKVDRKPARALTTAEFERVRAAVTAYATRRRRRSEAGAAARGLRRGACRDRRAAERNTGGALVRC